MVIIIGSPKPVIVSRASETHCGPAKIDFRWPDWPAREKVKYDPWNSLKPHSRTEKRSFPGLVTSRTTYFSFIPILIEHIMRRRNIISQKEEGKIFILFFLGKYRLYIRVNDL